MIKTEDFEYSCGCRSAGECFHNFGSELEALDTMVDQFAERMKAKLKKKWLDGYQGWDNPELEESLFEAFIEHAGKEATRENMVDVANFAAMLWNLKT